MITATPTLASRRAELDRLVEVLLEVHRELIAVARLDYESEHGRVAGAGELLGLLTEHPSFAWLRPLTSLVASIETAVEDDEIATAFSETRKLFDPESGPFAEAYYAALQRAPEAVMAHAALRDTLH